MPLRAATKSRLDLILVWTLVLGLPVLSLATVFGLRDVAAFAIAADSSDRWAGIVADALSSPDALTADGPTAEGLRRVASVLNPTSPVYALICDPSGRVIQSPSSTDIGRSLSASALRRLEAGQRVRGDLNMLTDAPPADRRRRVCGSHPAWRPDRRYRRGAGRPQPVVQ